MKTSVKPRLKLGVISDIHLLADPKPWRLRDNWDTGTLVKALKYFREREVDGVVIAGDLADSGLVFELEALAKAWWSVFPKDRLPNGNKVERLFVYGNHDIEGRCYDNDIRLKKDFPNDAERKALWIETDRAAAWEKAFHEPFELIWKKTVKGYLFIGAHWIDANGIYTLPEFYKRESVALPKDKPFFYIQHAHLRDTCYGDWAWGHDNGKSTKIWSKHPNCIAISGHSHYSLTDERSVWQGEFTSIGASSLRYSGQPHCEFPEGFENTISEGPTRSSARDAEKLLPTFFGYGIRQGMLMNLFDDRLVIERRDFVADEPLGADWVVPLPATSTSPAVWARRRAHFNAPQFDATAALRIERGKIPTRGKISKHCVAVKFPPANAGKERVYHYQVAVLDAEGNQCHLKRVLSPGWSAGKATDRYRSQVLCAFAIDELPAGELTLKVTPVGWLGNCGRALVAKI